MKQTSACGVVDRTGVAVCGGAGVLGVAGGCFLSGAVCAEALG
jgi:hypothetical protein